MLTVQVQSPDENALIKSAEQMCSVVSAIEIDSDEMYGCAAGELATIKGRAKALEEQRMAITRPLDLAKKQIMDLFRRPLEILGQAETALKRSMLTYQADQERVREFERRKAEEAARLERERLAKEAAAKEAAAKAEEARLKRESEAAAAAGRKAEAEALAAKAQETVDVAAAESQSLLDTAAIISAPVVSAPAPKAAGTSVKGIWKARCISKLTLIRHIAEHPEFENLLKIDDSALNQMAKALKKSFNVPGCEAYEEKNLGSRAA